MYNMRKRSDNFFFTVNNPVFANVGAPEPDTTAEDPAALEYMKSMERKYEPRKLRKNQNAYIRLDAVRGVRNSLAQVSIEDLVEMCILTPSTFDFAMLLHKICGDKYRCIDMVTQKWSRHDDETGEWPVDGGCVANLKRIISENMCLLFKTKLASVRALLDNHYISGEIAKPLDLKSKNLEYVIARLSALNTKNLIIKDATEIFYYSEVLDAKE
jgi:hypothetical protein